MAQHGQGGAWFGAGCPPSESSGPKVHIKQMVTIVYSYTHCIHITAKHAFVVIVTGNYSSTIFLHFNDKQLAYTCNSPNACRVIEGKFITNYLSVTPDVGYLVSGSIATCTISLNIIL